MASSSALRSLRSSACLLPLVLVWLVVTGCRETPPPDGMHHAEIAVAPAIDPLPGTQAMALELAAIYDEALREPFRYYYMNRAKAESLAVRVAAATGENQLRARFAYVYELILAGELDRAIQGLEALMDDLGEEAHLLSARSKPLYELLAISHLRRGELQNCVLNHSGASCILPLTPQAVHTRQEDAGAAFTIYEQLVAFSPDELTSRWLLNVAAMTLGRHPGAVPEPYRIALPRAATAGIPLFPNVAPALGVDVFGLAGGVSLEDFNGDGFLDILTTGYGLNEQLRLFLADGRGGFVDHTAASGLVGLVGGLNVNHADYDNDGDSDVLVLRGAWLGSSGAHPNSLLRNNGDGTFEDVTLAAGLGSRYPTQTGAWADFNRDGWIDLFVGNESGGGGGMGSMQSPGSVERNPSHLFLNNGDGTFSDVAKQVGVDVAAFVKGAAWGDIDNDGLADLYVSIIGEPNRLYHNLGGSSPADWRFEEIAGAAGVRGSRYTFPVFFWDYDNDGSQDLFVATWDPTAASDAGEIVAREFLKLPNRGEPNRLFHNNGDGTFTDVAPEAGLALSLFTMGLNFGDINGDGYLDIYFGTGAPDFRSLAPNRMFLNEQGRRFVDVTFEGGFGHIQKGHGIAFGDLDFDGDEDIYAVMGGAFEGDGFQNALFENPGVAPNSWVVLELEGRTSNRAAIGARIQVRVADRDGSSRTIYRTVSTGGSFGASSLRQEIGLGETDRIDEVEVSWPNQGGTKDTYRDLRLNTTYRLFEGGPAEPIPVTPVRLGGGR